MTWVRWLWDRYEALFALFLGFRPVAPGSVLRVRVMTYRGQPLHSGDQKLLPGARVLDLHLDNRIIATLGGSGREVAVRLRGIIRTEFPMLFRAVREANPPIAGVVGTSLLSMSARGLGFHVAPLRDGLVHRFLAFYMRWLSRLYRPEQEGRGRHGTQGAQVGIAWMTAAELARLAKRYGAAAGE